MSTELTIEERVRELEVAHTSTAADLRQMIGELQGQLSGMQSAFEFTLDIISIGIAFGGGAIAIAGIWLPIVIKGRDKQIKELQERTLKKMREEFDEKLRKSRKNQDPEEIIDDDYDDQDI